MTTEDSGGSVSYYKTLIEHPWDTEKEPYEAECGDIVDALEMTANESNVFKELWRKAAARQGRKKKGNSPIRSAEKIKFFSDRIHAIETNKWEDDK